MKFYRHYDCSECGAIQETLDELVMPYEALYVKDASRSTLPADTAPPVLVDEGRVIEGTDRIFQHLDELKKFREDWYKYQSDVCYCEE